MGFERFKKPQSEGEGLDRGGICRAWTEVALTGRGWRHQLGMRFLQLPLVRMGEVAGYATQII